MSEFNIQILGSRGSACVHNNSNKKYGGATSCVLVKAGKETIVIDAGSGMMGLTYVLDRPKHINLFFSHFHIDHVCGILSSPIMFDENISVDVYSAQDTYNKIKEIMKPPAWPVGPEAFTAKISFNTILDELVIGEVKISTIKGYHPGGVNLYRLAYNNKSFVYATDCEINYKNIDYLSEFCKGADLILCDGQYDNQQIKSKQGFGHSDIDSAVKLAKLSGAKMLGITHHDPMRTDEEIDEMQIELSEKFECSFFAKCGEVKRL